MMPSSSAVLVLKLSYHNTSILLNTDTITAFYILSVSFRLFDGVFFFIPHQKKIGSLTSKQSLDINRNTLGISRILTFKMYRYLSYI